MNKEFEQLDKEHQNSISKEVGGMPKLQLLNDFFASLDEPYELFAPIGPEAEERLGWLMAWSDLATFEAYRKLVSNLLKNARIMEIRRYESGVELVRYELWERRAGKKYVWRGPHLLDVKYDSKGEILAYTFAPEERNRPLRPVAYVYAGDEEYFLETAGEIIGFCQKMDDDQGFFLYDEDVHATVEVSCYQRDGRRIFTLEWFWGSFVELTLIHETSSEEVMIDFVRRYLEDGLGAAQQGLEWSSGLWMCEKNGGAPGELTEGRRMVNVSIYSFSYKRGVPGDEAGNGGGFVFDCRALPNPFWEDDLVGYTGMDAPVIEFFRRHRQPVDDFLAAAESLVRQSIEQYLDDGREHLQVAFGCTGGQHRSVFCADQMAKRLRGLAGVRVKVVHAAKAYWKIGEAVFGAD